MDDIDAVNAETFGTDIDSFVVGDLEEYSKQVSLHFFFFRMLKIIRLH